jgi:hypothetical protein
MAKTEASLQWGLTTDGRLLHVDDAPRGLDCDCCCPQCRSRVIAVQGDERAWHYRHHSDDAVCHYSPESDIHKYAKQVICDSLQLSYPQWHVGFRNNQFPVDLGRLISARPEITLAASQVRVDVLAQFERETVAVEIFVAHRVGVEKIKLLAQHEIPTFEIDLSYYPYAQKRKPEWDDAIVHSAVRRWLYPPACVRAVEAPLRAAYVAEQEAKAKAAHDASERAERERIERENKLRALQDERAKEQRAEEAQRLARAEADATRKLEEARRHERVLQAAARESSRIAENAKRRMPLDSLRRALYTQQQKQESPPDMHDLIVAHGGFHRIPPEAWYNFERAMQTWNENLRDIYRRIKANDANADPADAFPFEEHGQRYKQCQQCNEPAEFGYRDGERLRWFCRAHRLARWWADARI